MSEYVIPEVPMRVLHEEDAFVVVEKASGFLSVPGRGLEKLDSVAHRVRETYPGCIEHPAVQRLDMDTSGILVVARTAEAHRALSIQFQERQTEKRYCAILDGEQEGEQAGTIELPFRLDIENRPYQIYDEVHGKVGITHWEREGIREGRTRIWFRPVTGRTHQLRVHAAHGKGLGIPIVGDPLYGSGTGPGELRLHACWLRFRHPEGGGPMEFESLPGWW